MSQNIVAKNIRINAAPELVWKALTDPDQTRRYFLNAGVYSSFQAGSPITFRGRIFWIIPFEMKGVVLRAVPGRFLQYTLQNGHGATASVSTVTDILTYDNGQTILSITDDVGDAPGAEKRLARSEKGWEKILSGLKKQVESQTI